MKIHCPGCGEPVPPGRLKWCSRRCYDRMRNKGARAVATPLSSFPQRYRAALADGVDLLEWGDPMYECRECGGLICECERAA